MRGIERGRVGRAGKGGAYLLEKLFFREICIFVTESRIRSKMTRTYDRIQRKAE